MTLTKRNLLTFFLFSLFTVLLVCFVLRLTGIAHGRPYTDKQLINPIANDDFDPSLIRLDNMDKLIAYCDSFYLANSTQRTYPGIVSETLRNKFYHGYSYYSVETNPVAYMMEPLIKHGALAIVLPDDITKYPNAACSQQSIVGMEIFRRKGYQVRKISMFDSVANTGHFAYEVYYDKSWHFFDTNQEPDAEILKKYNRPSVAFLAKHPEIVLAAYHKKVDPSIFERLVENFKTGKVDAPAAPRANLFQAVTKFLSSFGWLIMGVVIAVRSVYVRRKFATAVNEVERPINMQQSRHQELVRPLESARAI